MKKSPSNHLWASIPASERARLLETATLVDLELSQVLCERDALLQYAYFPISCFISSVAVIPEHPGVEVGMVGNEGMLGAHLVLGMRNAPLRVLVQGAGQAWRIDAQILMQMLPECPALLTLLQRYLYVLLQQLASSAACLHFHPINQRLARWLLMSEDRAQRSSFTMTHVFLAYMLGVRRVSITNAASELQKTGVIHYHRGAITVLSRHRLKQAACSCYAEEQKRFKKWMQAPLIPVATPSPPRAASPFP